MAARNVSASTGNEDGRRNATTWATSRIGAGQLLRIACFAGMLTFAVGADAILLSVSGNNAALGGGPVQRWVLPPPLPAGPTPPTDQFVPDGATVPLANGRAWAADQVRYYYSELGGGFGPSDGIHVVPVVAGVFGGPDGSIFANPDPSAGIRDLDVSIVDNDLYAFTGSASGAPTVYRLSRVDGHVIGSPVLLQAPAVWDADGFTVLPNGNFLLNLGDASPIYQEFSSVTGAPVGTGFSVPCGRATGVDAGFSSLVIQCDFHSFLVTTFTGVVVETYLVSSNNIEDIEGVFGPPLPGISEPAAHALLGAGLVGLILTRRRARGSRALRK